MGKNYVDIENDHGATLRYRKHANGRGLVAHGAKVHPKAHIEAGAYIEPGARVGAGAIVARGARGLFLSNGARHRPHHAALAMTAQANSAPELVLQLLR